MSDLLPNAGDILTAALPIRNDPRYMLCRRAEQDDRFKDILAELDKGTLSRLARKEIFNMDGGPFFHDTRSQSIITAPATAITLAATDKLLHPGSLIAVPQGYFIAGKKLRLTIFGTMTTVLTPGNIGIELYVGSGDAGGTLVASSDAIALVASQTNKPMLITAYLKCNGGAVEGAKPVEGYATVWTPLSATDLFTVANFQAGGNGLIPHTAPAPVNIDNTLTTLGFNIQIKRSGSTAETFTTRDITFEALT